jgi:hypothetical protein
VQGWSKYPTCSYRQTDGSSDYLFTKTNLADALQVTSGSHLSCQMYIVYYLPKPYPTYFSWDPVLPIVQVFSLQYLSAIQTDYTEPTHYRSQAILGVYQWSRSRRRLSYGEGKLWISTKELFISVIHCSNLIHARLDKAIWTPRRLKTWHYHKWILSHMPRDFPRGFSRHKRDNFTENTLWRRHLISLFRKGKIVQANLMISQSMNNISNGWSRKCSATVCRAWFTMLNALWILVFHECTFYLTGFDLDQRIL